MEEELKAELKPCPFCGSKDVLNRCRGFISCNNCGALGPDGKTTEEYIDKWNARDKQESDS